MFETYGISCSDIFCGMKHLHIGSLPSTLICRRWSKFAKNNVNNIQSVMKQNQQIMDESVIPTQCSAKGHDRDCQGLDITNPTTVPPLMMRTSFTSFLQNLHNLGKTTDPAHVKDSLSTADYMF
ncbi:hypothetical protein VNO77_19560 [Canavalia gladiata]|uniref:Uncharacterized protein n=1 Tax=Canavalia gladiata TaxID=3824 RepID=A0AAN9LN02_CANGL